MTKNSALLFCSRDMHKFMEANSIKSVKQLFQIPLSQVILMEDFPYRLLEEWVTLKDRFQVLCEN